MPLTSTLESDGWNVTELGPNMLTPTQLQEVLAASPQRYRIGLAVFGDALAKYAIYSNGVEGGGLDPAWFIPEARANVWRGWGWPAWVGPLSMQRIQVVRSYARSSNGLLCAGTAPAGYPLSVQLTLALASAEWASVTNAAIHIGLNDTLNGAPIFGGRYPTVQECATELLAQIARIGKPVTLISAPPTNTGPTTVVGESLQRWAWLLEWRAVCKRIADESKGWVSFVDGYSLGNSPTAAADVLAAGSTYDNLHSNNVYAYKIADAVVSSLIPSGVSGDLDLWPSNTSAATAGAVLMDQGFANPTLGVASGGSGTGVIAGSLTVANQGGATHIGSIVSNPYGLGNMQRIAITNAGAGDGVLVTSATFHAAGGTFLAAGDKCWAQALVTVNSGGIYPRNLQLKVEGFQSPTTYTGTLFAGQAVATDDLALPLTATRTYLLRTPTLTMPAGAAFSNLQIKFLPAFAGAGACSIDIGSIECRRFRGGGVYS